MTAYPVCTDEHTAPAQQPPVYTSSQCPPPSPTLNANTGNNNNMNSQTEIGAQPAPATQQASTFNRKLHSMTSKAGWPLNKAANVIGAEGWWPTSMEKECVKAARILHSFTSAYTLRFGTQTV